MLYAGALRHKDGSPVEVVPLMTTGPDSGAFRWNQLVRQTLFGVALAQGLSRKPDEEIYTLAARVPPRGRARRRVATSPPGRPIGRKQSSVF